MFIEKLTRGGVLRKIKSRLTTALDVTTSGEYALDAATGKVLNEKINNLIEKNSFNVTCTTGKNIIDASTILNSGKFPSFPRKCIYSVVGHSHAATQTTVEADGNSIIIFNSGSAQNIVIFWVYVK